MISEPYFTNTNYKPSLLPEGYVPSKTDVLCGRGKGNTLHEGNRNFTKNLRANLQTYMKAPSRLDKSVVIASLASTMQHDQGVKFIKLDPKSRRFMEISNDEVHEKIGHAMRALLRQKNSCCQHHAQVSPTRKTKKRRPYGSYSATASMDDDWTQNCAIGEEKPLFRKVSVEASNERKTWLTASGILQLSNSVNCEDFSLGSQFQMMPSKRDDLNQKYAEKMALNPLVPPGTGTEKEIIDIAGVERSPSYLSIFDAPSPGETFSAQTFFEEALDGDVLLAETRKPDSTSCLSSTSEYDTPSSDTPITFFDPPLSPALFSLSSSVALHPEPNLELYDI